MDLRDLRYFEVIAELEHVGKAAQKLNKSQPTLTSCLRRLEEMAGGPLIAKTGRGIRLTPAGIVLRDWAKTLRLSARDASCELRDVVNGVVGQVHIGLIPSAAQFLFSRIAKTVLTEMPEVRVRTEIATHATLASKLHQGDLDFMVVGESYAEPNLLSMTIMQDSVVPVAHRDHAIFCRKKLTLASLGEFRWILQPDSVLPRQWLDSLFDKAQLPRPIVQLETNMLNLVPELIEQSGLISFLPRLQLNESSSLKEIDIQEAVMTRRLEVRYRKNAYLSPVAQRVIDLLIKVGNHNEVSATRVAS